MKVFQIRQDDRFAWYETSKEHMEDMVNKCNWQGRVLELAKDDSAQPVQQPAPVGSVHQFRTKGASDWYDGHPDNEDGGGPYEVRILYAAPVAAPVAGQEPYGWQQHIDGVRTQNFARDEQELEQIKMVFRLMKTPGTATYLPLYTAAPVPAASVVQAESAPVVDMEDITYLTAHIKRAKEIVGCPEDDNLIEFLALAQRAANVAQPVSDAALPKLIPRGPWDDENPDGMLESDDDYVAKNMELAVALLGLAAHPANIAQVGELSDAKRIREEIYGDLSEDEIEKFKVWRAEKYAALADAKKGGAA